MRAHDGAAHRPRSCTRQCQRTAACGSSIDTYHRTNPLSPSCLMKSANYLLVAPILALWLIAGMSLSQAAERPKVLLILVDDLKPALGCYGDAIAKTPCIDSLAANGMRFDLAYCHQAVCAPSRYTLMLGVPPKHPIPTLQALQSRRRYCNAFDCPLAIGDRGKKRTANTASPLDRYHGYVCRCGWSCSAV